MNDIEYIYFNSLYTLKPDDGRALILARWVGRNLLDDIDDSFTNAVHPIYAMILSFVDGSEKSECIKAAADYLKPYRQPKSGVSKKQRGNLVFSASHHSVEQ